MRKLFFISTLMALSLSLSQCRPITPTFNRENIVSSVVNFCAEKNIQVEAKIIGSTLWVYYPTTELINELAEFNEKEQERMTDVLEVIQRIALSCADALEFFVFVVTDVKNLGIERVMVGNIQDIRKAQVLGISRYEYFDRILQSFSINPEAVGAYKGKYLDYVDISFPKFLAEQIVQRIKKKFSEDETLSEYYKVTQEDWNVEDGIFVFDITLDKISEKATGDIDPQKIMLEIISSVLKSYEFVDFKEVQLRDPLGEGYTYLSREQILESKTK